GDHGLISVVIGAIRNSDKEKVLDIDTWLMSCRVLSRGVEQEVLNEICRLAAADGCRSVTGTYIKTSKNELVHEHYEKLGFALTAVNGASKDYSLELAGYQPLETRISVVGRAYERESRDGALAEGVRQYLPGVGAGEPPVERQ